MCRAALARRAALAAVLRACAVLLLAAGLGCAGEGAPLRTSPPVHAVAEADCGAPRGLATRAGHPLEPARLCVRLSLPPGATAPAANVVLAWFRPQEQARFAAGLYPPFDLLATFLERARIVPAVTLATAAELALDYPGGDAVVLAVADVHQTFWPTLFGAGAGNFIGVSPPSVAATPSMRRAQIALTQIASRPPAAEACAGERLELVRLDAPEVAGSVGNPTSRRMCVLLPASYARERARRYPVVYLLPGFASDDTVYLDPRRGLREKLDAAAQHGEGEAIIVGIDTSSRHGSSYFTDSAAGGRWAQLASRLTAEIDRRYRTRPEARSRAVVGHSTGGFNAVSLALDHPELFSVLGASAPDGLDFESWLLDEQQRVRPLWLAWSRLENALGGAGQMLSYAAAWSPPSARFPFDLERGVPDPQAWPHWRARSPLRLLDDASRVATVKRTLAGRIFLIVGRRDEFGLFAPTLRFDARLTELGIAHQLTLADSGHDSQNVQPAILFAVRTMQTAPPR